MTTAAKETDGTMSATASQPDSDPPPNPKHPPPPDPAANDDDDDDDGSVTTAQNNSTSANNNKKGCKNVPLLSASQMKKRRGFTKKQNIRRRVYRELTVYRMFPLQAMAVDDYDERMKDYCLGDGDGGGDGGSDNGCLDDDADADCDGSGSASRRSALVARQRASANDPNGATASSVEDDDNMLREQYQREFLRERAIPMSNQADVAAKDGGENQQAKRGLDNATNISNATQKNGDGCSSAPANGGDACDEKENMPEQCNETSNSIPVELKDTAQPNHPEDQNQQKESAAISSSDNQQPIQSNTQNLQPLFQSTLWSMEPRIFACETTIKGKRRYISAHLGRFMDHYWRECDAHGRHYYELIKEDTPCRLYFDLEFNKRANPKLTPTITENILTELFDELQSQYQRIYNISIERSDMVDLESSTPKKFSRHWILHLPGGNLFSDAREAGVFIKAFVARLEEEKASGELRSRGRELLADNLLVHAEKSEEGNEKLAHFIDLGVYTRNRIFRIMGSTKFGKPTDAALRIADANKFPFPDGFDNGKFYLPEMSSALSTNSSVDGDGVDTSGDANQDDDFDFDSIYSQFCKSLSWEDHAAAMAATLIVPANASKMNYPILTDPSDLLTDDEKQKMTSLRLNGSGARGTSKFPRAAPSYGSSPLPKLDRFIVNTLGKRQGLVGMIGTYSIGTQQPFPQTICYNMKDNRFCENVERSHKSNNIIWNCHLVDRKCWQSCHDPECRGFRGKSIDLPEEIHSEIDEYFLDFELSSLNEDEIIANKENSQIEEVCDIGEFDDPALEAAMCHLDVSSVARENDAESALDDELGMLNLSGIVSSNCGKSNSISEEKNCSLMMPTQTAKPTISESACENNSTQLDTSSVARENDAESALDDEIGKLNLSDIVSSSYGKSDPLSDKENCNVKMPNQNAKSTISEAAIENNFVELSEPWENDDSLDSELGKLSLADILSS